MLAAVGSFTEIGEFNVAAATPSLDELRPYGSALVYFDGNPRNTTALGDVLADYFDAGGTVVLAFAANATRHLGGRFQDQYGIIDWGSDEALYDRLGLVSVPKSPLMAGVRTLVAKRAYRSTGRVLHGGQVIAEWAILGRPLIVVGTFGARKVVSLNLFPVPSTAGDDFIAGDLGILLRNALLYR